jgi:nickel transport protein
LPDRPWRLIPWFFAAMLASGVAWCHGLSIFAAADGARIEGQVRFSGGGPSAQGRVRVLDPRGALLAEIQPDAEGRFDYLAVAPEDHLLVAESADGHRAEWRIAADELAAGFAPASSVGGKAGGATGGCADLPAIEQAVARAVRPLREALALERERARLRDILGGIGYILGLAGLWAWWRSRDRGGPS